jgi:thiaminase/transcriptional activator TenA
LAAVRHSNARHGGRLKVQIHTHRSAHLALAADLRETAIVHRLRAFGRLVGVIDTWTASLWDAIDPTYGAILQHPFLAGLADGTLPEESFAYYLAQDAHYLRDYARALAVVGAKAPTHQIAGMFGRHAAETVEVELALHATLLPELGINPDELHTVAVSPTTTAYTSYLLAAAYGGSFCEALAAVLPCYWIYQRVGGELLRKGSPQPRYQRWIETYGGDAFAATVEDVLAVANETGHTLGSDERRRSRGHFVATARYEWMFWDAAWRLESWPI